MPAFTEYFCGLCNPSCQRRDPGDEVNTGYTRLPLEMGMPGTWTPYQGNNGVEYACGRCEASKERFDSSLEQRHSALTTVADLAGTPPGTSVRRGAVTATNTEGPWPSRTSPFGASGESTVAKRVDEQDDRGVRADGE